MLSAFLIYSLRNFVTSFLGAIIFYVLFKPMAHHLISKKHWKKTATAWLIILISFLLVVVPLSGLIYLVISKVSNMFGDSSGIATVVNLLDEKMNLTFHASLFNENLLQKIQSQASLWISSFLNGLLQISTSIAVMYFFEK